VLICQEVKSENNENKTIKKRAKRQKIEDLPLPSAEKLDFLASTLAKQIDDEIFAKKYVSTREVLKIIGAGLFLGASLMAPNLPKALKPYAKDSADFELWKRFNIPYLKRTLHRLEKQKLVESSEENGKQIVKITDSGRRRVLKFALDEIEIKKPKKWDGKWVLVSYDIPEHLASIRNFFSDYLKFWGFYPLQESVWLHAYSCEKEVDFLREYLGIGEHVRVMIVSKIENNQVFRDFFGV